MYDPNPEYTHNQTSSGTPFIYRSVQQPAPPETGFSSTDAALRMLGPIIAKHMGGMSDPRFLPQVGPGISPYESFYARDVNTRLYQAGREQQHFRTGGMFGDVAGQVGNQLGLNRMLGMSPTEFREQTTNAGQTPVGRMIAEQLTNMPAVQGIMGGNVNKLFDTNFKQKNLIGMANSPFAMDMRHPMDVEHQTEMTRSASKYNDEVLKSIYQRPGGGMGITPNTEFTQGFKVDDIAKLSETMVNRDADGIRGKSGEEQAKRLGDMTKVIRALSDTGGGNSVGELLQNLDRLTQGDWTKVNPQDLERTFREISATGRILGVSGEQMLQSVASVQQNVDAGLGISPAARALGVSSGGYGSLPVAVEHAQMIQAIGSATGKSHDPVAMAQIEARQMAMLNIGMESDRGKDMQHIAYLAQTGQIEVDTYKDFTNAMQYGTREQSRSMADVALKQAYGEADAGRKLFSDPAIRMAMVGNTNEKFAGDVTRNIFGAQGMEFGERMQRRMITESYNTGSAQRMAAGMGQNLITGVAEADRDMAFMKSYFADMGSPAGTAMSATVSNVYEEAVARAREKNPNISDAQAARAGMSAVNSEIANSSQFTNTKNDLNTQRQYAKQVAENDAHTNMDSEISERGKMNNALSLARSRSRNMSGPEGEALRDEVKAITGLRREESRLRRSGDISGADAKLAELTEAYDTMRGGIASNDKMQTLNADLTANEEIYERENTNRTRLREAGNVGATRIAEGRKSGTDSTHVFSQQEALLRIMQGVADGSMTSEDAAAALALSDDRPDVFTSLTSEERERAISAVRGGQGEGLNAAIREQSDITGAINRNMLGTAGATGVGDVFKGIGENALAQDIVGALQSGMVSNEARADAALSGVGASLNKTFPQLIVEAATGEVSIARALGLQDAGGRKSQFNKVFGKDTRALLATSTDKSAAAREALTASFESAEDLTRNTELRDTGAAANVLDALSTMANLSGAEGGLTDEKYNDLVHDTLNKTPELSIEARREAQKTMSQHRDALALGKEASDAVDAFEKGMTTEERNRLAAAQQGNVRDETLAQEKAVAAMAESDVGRFGGTFASDLDIRGMSKAEQRAAASALNTINEGSVSSNWLRTKDSDLRAGFESVAAMSSEDIAALSPEKQQAIGALAELQQKQSAEGGKDGEDGSSAREIKLSGTLQLYDKEGSLVGVATNFRERS